MVYLLYNELHSKFLNLKLHRFNNYHWRTKKQQYIKYNSYFGFLPQRQKIIKILRNIAVTLSSKPTSGTASSRNPLIKRNFIDAIRGNHNAHKRTIFSGANGNNLARISLACPFLFLGVHVPEETPRRGVRAAVSLQFELINHVGQRDKLEKNAIYRQMQRWNGSFVLLNCWKRAPTRYDLECHVKLVVCSQPEVFM